MSPAPSSSSVGEARTGQYYLLKLVNSFFFYLLSSRLFSEIVKFLSASQNSASYKLSLQLPLRLKAQVWGRLFSSSCGRVSFLMKSAY